MCPWLLLFEVINRILSNFLFFLILSSGSMHHICRSLWKGLPLNNRVILLVADVFTDSFSGDSDGFTIIVVEMMEKELGDWGTVCSISDFDGLMVQTDEDDSVSLYLWHLACNSLLQFCMFLVHFQWKKDCSYCVPFS